MCVTYPTKKLGKEIQLAFINEGIPSQWLNSQKNKKEYDSSDDSVTIVTMHSSKGLEFPIVAVSCAGIPSNKNSKTADEAKLLYVAMTRSTEKLLITSHEENELFNELGMHTT